MSIRALLAIAILLGTTCPIQAQLTVDRPRCEYLTNPLGIDVAAEREREACVLTGLETIDRRRRGAVIAGETPRAKARALFDSSLRDLIEAP